MLIRGFSAHLLVFTHVIIRPQGMLEQGQIQSQTEGAEGGLK
jgi:hypothetical protein